MPSNAVFGPRDYYVLDGGFASQLEKYLPDMGKDPLWSARSLHTHPDLVVKVHKDFISAGARVIITNSYQASLSGFKEHLGMEETQAYGLIQSSVDLAKKAIREAGRVPGHVLVAGSIGPYGACQHDGSEYSGRYLDTITRDELGAWHLPRIQALQGANLLAIETLPSWREGVAVLDCLAKVGVVKAWVSFTLKDGLHTASGESVAESVKYILDHKVAKEGRVVAIGVNCSHPTHVTEFLKEAKKVTKGKVPFLVYPNSGEDWDGERHCWMGPAVEWMDLIPEWVGLGVMGVGGCCRVEAPMLSRIGEQLVKGILAKPLSKEYDLKTEDYKFINFDA